MLCRSILSAATPLYYLAWSAREAGFHLHLLPIRKVGARVISIGNITAGGTGKTPAVIYFARKFQKEGAQIAIISRGYGRRSKSNEPVVVSDKEGNILLSANVAGDEPYLLAKKLPRVSVIVCPNRIAGAEVAMKWFSPDIILLDDGFQHRAIERDEDIVVIDCSEPFGYNHLLPRGLLREPLRALKRASAFLLTRADERKHAALVEKLREMNPSAEIMLSRHRPTRLLSAYRNTTAPLGQLKGKKTLALSSIGNPSSFERTLERLQAILAGSLRFPDHHWYSVADLAHIRDEAKRTRAEIIVTTEKDGVRLALLPEKLENLLLLEIELEIIGDLPTA